MAEREGYKKTAIRMPDRMWDELVQMAYDMGMSVNGTMVMWISQKMAERRAQNNLMSPEAIGAMIKAAGLSEQLAQQLKDGRKEQ